MKSYNDLLDKLQLIHELEDGDNLFNILSILSGLILEVDGNLKGAKYRETFRYKHLSLTVNFGRTE